MSEKIYTMLARAFAAEGVDVCFGLMGDGNMHFMTTLAGLPDVRAYFVRHEHCACTMAAGFSRARDTVGVASVTCGPGLTQITTALASASASNIPMVIFAGESPLGAAWYGQRIEQAPIVVATGAHYIACHSAKLMAKYVSEAFFIARTQNRPVVLGVPYDLQQLMVEDDQPYQPSTDFIPTLAPLQPPPTDVAAARVMIEAAQRIVVLGGRGARLAGAADACRALAARTGALLATTLPARGLFCPDPFELGVAGGYSSAVTRDMMAKADLIIAVGASLTSYTADSGKLFPGARVIQIDEHPVGVKHARRTADHYLRADARLGVEALIEAVGTRAPQAGWRDAETARRIAQEPADTHDFPVPADTIDPRRAVAALDAALPKDWVLVNGTGHNAHFSVHMRGRKADDFITIREFGAIGNALSQSIGVAAARPDATVVVIDGDGSVLMHMQEMETIRRYNLRILVCILNDGAYGPEIHRLRAQGLSDAGAVFGRGDMGRMAEGYGIRGRVVTAEEQIATLTQAFTASEGPEVWDIHIADTVISPMTRRSLVKHG
ncbi:thiamine pyrophosphate-binding protein [Devosia ginsengisoli]|uniref:Thiamine pyrophosphate-binding protein n=1 Tax=Devosia ginsengisoli TaxID=400770 RepID=A0A5B8M0A9_9HYPH|nr:thiamine pyrophosphate-binding protein [Devosia ginsengisoli]QDZ13122.1 thiamine pyrophosphate-binding protein [Devosia ginsengisoli]